VTHAISTTDTVLYVDLVDVDADSDLDVLASIDGTTSEIVWWENASGDGSAWTQNSIYDARYSPQEIQGIDIDGDADLDVVVAEKDIDKVRWNKNEPSGGIYQSSATYDAKDTFQSTTIGSPRNIACGDVDGDSLNDVVVSSESTDGVKFIERAFILWAGERVVDDGTYVTGARKVQLGDVDGDSDIDVVVADYSGNKCLWFENANGGGTSWTYHLIKDAVANAYTVDVGDFDGKSRVLSLLPRRTFRRRRHQPRRRLRLVHGRRYLTTPQRRRREWRLFHRGRRRRRPRDEALERTGRRPRRRRLPRLRHRRRQQRYSVVQKIVR